MIALLDGDVATYRCGFAAEKKSKKQLPDGDIEHVREAEPLSHALQNVDTLMGHLADRFEKIEVFLSGSGNFRLEVLKDYKANRSPFAKPLYYNEVREHLSSKYGATIINGMEADDAMGIEQTKRDGTCIVTIDKDLDQIAGHHYNWVKNEKYYINETDGIRHFYKQLLTGDRVDNLFGIYGIGPKRAEALLGHLHDELRMWRTVRATWHDYYPGNISLEHFGTVRPTDQYIYDLAQCLWIRRHKREQWSPPA